MFLCLFGQFFSSGVKATSGQPVCVKLMQAVVSQRKVTLSVVEEERGIVAVGDAL